MPRLIRLKLLAMVIALVGTLMLQSDPIAAASGGEVGLNPGSMSVQKGVQFSWEIRVDTGAARTLGWQLGLSYDPRLLEVVEIAPSSWLREYVDGTPGGDFVWEMPFDWRATPGRVVGAQAVVNDRGGGGPSGQAKLATVTFRVKDMEGVAGVQLTDVVVNGLAGLKLKHGSVAIVEPPTPTSTPTATPTPQAYTATPSPATPTATEASTPTRVDAVATPTSTTTRVAAVATPTSTPTRVAATATASPTATRSVSGGARGEAGGGNIKGSSLSNPVGASGGADLVVVGQTTREVPGQPGRYYLDFKVRNQGRAVAGANPVHVVVNRASLIEILVPALGPGSETETLTVGPLAFGDDSAEIVIAVDAVNAVAEIDEINNICQFPINAQLASFIDLTAPAEISGWVLTAGQNNDRAGGTLNVKANVNWAVQISGTNAGKMHEYNNSTSQFVNPGAELIQQLQIGSENPLQSLTGSLAAFCDGLRTEQVPSVGHNFEVRLRQTVGYNDMPVTKANHGYRVVVTFIATPQP